MDVWLWWSFWPHTGRRSSLSLSRRASGSGVAHAVGNVVIALVAGPELRRLLDRYGRRLRVEVVWA